MKSQRAVDDLLNLVRARRSHLVADSNWINYDDDDVRRAFVELETFQAQILDCDLGDGSSKLIALSLLVEGDEHPNFADEFKNRLFEKLRRVCESETSHFAPEDFTT